MMTVRGGLGSGLNNLSHIEAGKKDAPRQYSADLTTDGGGHILDASQLGAESEGVQTTPDKKIILIPQPS